MYNVQGLITYYKKVCNELFKFLTTFWLIFLFLTQFCTFLDHQLTRSFHCVPPYSKPEEEPLPASHPTKSAPLPAASKLVPVPEPLISPMVTSNPPLNVLGMRGDVSKADPISASKLQTIKSAAEKKKSKQSLANERGW